MRLGPAETVGEFQEAFRLQRLAAERQHVVAVQRIAHCAGNPVGQRTRQIDSGDLRPHAGIRLSYRNHSRFSFPLLSPAGP
jgi:hypothetical protein